MGKSQKGVSTGNDSWALKNTKRPSETSRQHTQRVAIFFTRSDTRPTILPCHQGETRGKRAREVAPRARRGRKSGAFWRERSRRGVRSPLFLVPRRNLRSIFETSKAKTLLSSFARRPPSLEKTKQPWESFTLPLREETSSSARSSSPRSSDP